MNESPVATSNPKRFRHAIEYYAARILLGMLGTLPLAWAVWVGRRFGDLARLVDRNHRGRAQTQVRERLNLDQQQAAAFVKKTFRNYGMVVAEFAHLSRLSPERFGAAMDLSGFDEMCHELLSHGKGIIFISGHQSNWEWAAAAPRVIGIQGGSVARPLDNPRLNALINSIREIHGQRILEKQGAIRRALSMLRKNQGVAFLVDQDAGPRGLMSPFLGKPASSITFPAQLAIRSGAPMVVCAFRRARPSEKTRFKILFSNPIWPGAEKSDEEAATRRLVDRCNAELGQLIMESPEEWFWIHRRWKSQGIY